MGVFHQLVIKLEAEHERELQELRTNFRNELQKLHSHAFPDQTTLDNNDEDGVHSAHLEEFKLAPQWHNETKARTSINSSISDAGFDAMESFRFTPFHHASTDNGADNGDNKSLAPSSFRSSMTQEPTQFQSGELLSNYIQMHVNKRMKQRNKIMGAFLVRKRTSNTFDDTRCVVKLVNTTYFDSVCAVMIMLNAFFLGVATHYDESSSDSFEVKKMPMILEITDNVFSVWFLTELVLRMKADSCMGFWFLSPNVRWNLFDAVVVGSDITEIFIRIAHGWKESQLGSLTVMRLLRVLRVARALRVLRLVNFFVELRLMVKSLMTSGMALFWSMVMLFMVIYIFGIFLMQAVSLHLREETDPAYRGPLLRWFGTLPKVGFTLFLCVTNGVSWHVVADLLTHVHWTNTFVLAFFIFFTVFAMLNIITGIFVETALSAVQNDKDEVIREEKHSENSVMSKLEAVFQSADKEKNGGITLEEFEGILGLEETRILMKTIGLEINEAKGMFNLMDADRSGQVSIQEFLVGCMRMKGGAKAVDLITLMYENRKLMDMWSNYATFMEDQFTKTRKWEAHIEKLHEKLIASVRSGIKHNHNHRHSPNKSDRDAETRASPKAKLKEVGDSSLDARHVVLL